MGAWTNTRQREIAEIFGDVLSKRQGWKSKVFLPQDSTAVVFHGPRFDFLDEGAIEEAIGSVESKYKIKFAKDFWSGGEMATLGEVVAAMAERSEA
jgi:hypothetical protein